MLSDIMELSKMNTEQLAQLCEALYSLLQHRDVTVHVQHPVDNPYGLPISHPISYPPVFTPNTNPTFGMLTKITSNEGTQQERFGVR